MRYSDYQAINNNFTVPTISGATPSVLGFNAFLVTNGSPTTMTNLTGEHESKVVRLLFANGNTTIGDAGVFRLNGNFTSVANAVLVLQFVNGLWYEVSRSANG